MLDWVNFGADRVDAAAQADREFQALLAALRAVEDAHAAILNKLSPEDRETILEYEDLMTEIEYRKTQIAYNLNKRA